MGVGVGCFGGHVVERSLLVREWVRVAKKFIEQRAIGVDRRRGRNRCGRRHARHCASGETRDAGVERGLGGSARSLRTPTIVCPEYRAGTPAGAAASRHHVGELSHITRCRHLPAAGPLSAIAASAVPRSDADADRRALRAPQAHHV